MSCRSVRLNQVSNETWAMIENQELESRNKIVALIIAESAATNIIEILTNNKQLAYAALKIREAEAKGETEPKGDTEPKGEEEPPGDEEPADEED